MAGIPSQPPNSDVVGKDGQFKQEFARYWDAIARKAGSALQSFAQIFNLDTIGTIDTDADYLVVYDADEGVAKKALVETVTGSAAALVTLIETVSATSGSTATSATIDFATLKAQGYRDLEIRYEGISTNANDVLVLEVSDDGGTTWNSASNVNSFALYRSALTVTILLQGNGLTIANMDAGSSNTVDGCVIIENFADDTADFAKDVRFVFDATVIAEDGRGGGCIVDIEAIDKVRLRLPTNNFDGSGTYKIYARS